jgi:hypothetical protein
VARRDVFALLETKLPAARGGSSLVGSRFGGSDCWYDHDI